MVQEHSSWLAKLDSKTRYLANAPIRHSIFGIAGCIDRKPHTAASDPIGRAVISSRRAKSSRCGSRD